MFALLHMTTQYVDWVEYSCVDWTDLCYVDWVGDSYRDLIDCCPIGCDGGDYVAWTDGFQIDVPRERMRSPQPTINYSVNIPTWGSFIQCRRQSARRAARIAGWPS